MGANLAQAGFAGFNSAEIEPDSYEDLPAGSYTAVITDSVLKDTKAGNGKYLELTIEVIDGPMKGRKVWERLNIVNPNPTTVQIAAKALSSIARSVGIFGLVEDTAVLHDKPFVVKVVYKGDDKRLSYSASGSAPAPSMGGVSGAPAAPARKPWER